MVTTSRGTQTKPRSLATIEAQIVRGRDADEPAASSGGGALMEFAVRVAAVVFRASDPLQSTHQGAAAVEQGQEGQSITGGELLLGGGLTCGGGARRVRAERRGGGGYDLVWLRDGKARCGEGRAFKGEGRRSRRGAAENPGDLSEIRARALRCGGDGPGGWGHVTARGGGDAGVARAVGTADRWTALSVGDTRARGRG